MWLLLWSCPSSKPVCGILEVNADKQVLHKAVSLPMKLPQTVTAQRTVCKKKSVIADVFLFFGTPLHVKSFAEPAWSAWSSITIAQLALVAIIIHVACAVN